MVKDLIEAAQAYMPTLDVERLNCAFKFAEEAHEGQERKDGSPYITHPLNAALILTGLKVDEDTLIACLLHDVPEDTDRTLKEIETLFGKKVVFLVDGITKLSKVHYRDNMEERQIESLKKLFIHSAQDPRIILIKLADRLHNMKTLDAISKPEKQRRIAKETLEIFVPIANLLGIWELKSQLEDLCFKVLQPEAYNEIHGYIQELELKRKDLLEKSCVLVASLLKERKVPFISIEGRNKSHYSIYKKNLRTKKDVQEIYDLIGLRVVIEDIPTCYQVLGVLHQQFTPKIGRLKDYIAIPKTNGYQSIHTTVFGVEGMITEVQIRTQEMHLENEYGIAAHYFYRKQQEKKRKMVQKKLQKKYEWVQRILDLQRDIKSNKKFMRGLKLDIFEDRIFVFTPKGDVIDLPEGANVVDFAYHIHSEVGMLAVSAEINGKNQTLFTKLQNGDVVRVNTSEAADGPQIKWLDSVKTNLARNKVREFLRERDKATMIMEAENSLDSRLGMFGIEGARSLSNIQKVMLVHHFDLPDWEALLFEMGKGTLLLKDIVHELHCNEDWPHDENNKVCLIVELKDRIGILADLSRTMGELGINISRLQSFDGETDETVMIEFVFYIHSLEEYENTLEALHRIPGVLKTTRVHNGESKPSTIAAPHKVHAQE